MKRHLACYIWPHICGQWRRTAEHLRQRWELFDGIKIISVAIDECSDSLDDVKEAFDFAEGP